MKSLCLFASYFKSESVPYYVHVYLKELKRQFEDVYFLTSKEKLHETDESVLKRNNIHILHLQNKGFDFGLWYQALQKIDVNAHNSLALVNDSCVLFKSLDGFMNWAERDLSDIKGMTRSEAIFPHLQSYFLLLNKKAIPYLLSYFNEHKLLKDISDVIQIYEVGLSRFWYEKGLTISSYLDNDGYTGEFSPYYFCVEEHIKKGIPLIKKKIIYCSYRRDELHTLARMNFNIDRGHYFSLLSGKKDLIIDLNILKSEGIKMSGWEIAVYNLKRFAIRLLRPIYKLIKNA
ncbi:MAG: hypothetical protein JNL60_12615 [Bacteroidia bacterium]|nr:hypothetical protein [Bacteroidia bacterium]